MSLDVAQEPIQVTLPLVPSSHASRLQPNRLGFGSNIATKDEDIGVVSMKEENTMQEDESHDDDDNSDDEDGDADADEDIVREEIEECLEGSLELHGTFAFCQSYNSPIPALTVVDFGTIGFPLNSREAAHIQSYFIPSAANETTWEMEGSKAVFRNPAWSSWLNKVVSKVCKELGVNSAMSPKAVLRKLLLYKTGSEYEPVVETGMGEKTFATVMIILPSEFTDGNVLVSHGKETKDFDTSGVSLIETTVLAWHTGVNLELKAITSGLRFALLYNLVHTGETAQPTLATADQRAFRLRRALLSWSKSSTRDLDRLIITLKQHRSKATLSSSVLQGTDARVFAILDGLAGELDMCLGLVNVTHTQRGSGRDEGGEERERRRYDYEYQEEDEDEDDEDVEMDEVEDTTTTMHHLVNAQGKPIRDSLDFDDERETIPCLDSFFEEEMHDEQEYEGWQGDCAGGVTRRYHRAAVVIWPRWGSLGSDGSADQRCTAALEKLHRSLSPRPTSEETILFKYILEHSQDLSKSRAIKVLCPSSRRWKDQDYWERSVRACAGDKSSILTFDELSAASSLFGFNGLSATVRDFIFEDTSNTSRFAYVSNLVKWASTLESSTLQHDITEFAAITRRLLFLNVRPPTIAEVELLVNEAQSVLDVQKILVPQLVDVVTDVVLEALASYLGKISLTIGQTPEDGALLKAVMGELLAGQIPKIDFFKNVEISKPNPPPGTYGSIYQVHQPQQQSGSPDITLAFLKKCVEAEHSRLATAAIKHVLDMDAVSPLEAQARAKAVLLPLVPLIVADPDLRAALSDDLVTDLGRTAIQLSLDRLNAQVGRVTRSELALILDGAVASDNTEMIVNVVLPTLKALPWNEEGWKAVIEEVHCRRKLPPAELGDLFHNTTYDMSKVYAAKVALNFGSGYSYSYGPRKVASAFAFCFTRGGPAALQVAIQRTLQSNLSSPLGISDELIPLLGELLSLAQQHNFSPSLEPFASAVKKILLAWSIQVLGPQPATSGPVPVMEIDLARYTCACQECAQVKSFLRGGEASFALARIGAPKRKHVEKELSNSHIQELATYKMISTVPQGLEIKKTPAVHARTAWAAKQTKGYELLRNIGPEVLQKQVLGDDYSKIIQSLEGGSAGKGALSTLAPRASALANSVRPSTIVGLISGARARGPESKLMPMSGDPKVSRTVIPTAAGSTSRIVAHSLPSTHASRPGPTTSIHPTHSVLSSSVASQISRTGMPTATGELPNQAAGLRVPSTHLARPVPTTLHSTLHGLAPPPKRKIHDTIDLTTPSPEPEPKRAR